LNGSADTFVTVLAAESSAVLSTISSDGTVKSGIPAKIDTTFDGKATEPSEICWMSVSEDNKYAFGANFGYGTVSVFSLDQSRLSVKISEAAKEKGDGKFKGLAGALSSGAGDNAVLAGFLYQLYANASKLVGYRIEDDGALTKIAEVSVPRNSTQGLGKI
jgi:6-phosphogluconolactonase (cycloisomerase 2 family)